MHKRAVAKRAGDRQFSASFRKPKQLVTAGAAHKRTGFAFTYPKCHGRTGTGNGKSNHFEKPSYRQQNMPDGTHQPRKLPLFFTAGHRIPRKAAQYNQRDQHKRNNPHIRNTQYPGCYNQEKQGKRIHAIPAVKKMCVHRNLLPKRII